MKRRIVLQLICMIMGAAIVFAEGSSLTDLLPEGKNLKQTVPVDAPVIAKGDNLYKLINGGAVSFFKNGFKEALFQEYTVNKKKQANIEIYHMGTPENAKTIFDLKTDPSLKKLLIGEQGIFGDYYCAFHRKNYYVTVTGSDQTKEMEQTIRTLADLIDKNISKTTTR